VPTRLERDISIEITSPGADPGARLLGNRDFDSEKLLAWELGYRRQVSPRLAVDVASFLNRYRGLASLELGEPFTEDGRTVFPIVNENLSDGRAAGAEALVTFSPVAHWRLTASYAYLDLEITPHGEDNNRGEFAEGATPRHQLGLRSAMDLGNVQVDAFLRHSSRIRREPQIVSGEGIAAYTELDLRVAYAWQQLQFAVTLQNLLHRSHIEFGAPAQRGGIERSVFAGISWQSR
jgi:iron complex outermembrane receptor protein